MSFIHRQRILALLLPFVFVTGCISSQQIVTGKAPALFRQVALSANRQSDVVLVRQGIPAYIMLIDGMAQSYPGNKDLLLALAQAYSAYAAVLEEDEQDRAAHLNEKAKRYALRALELTHPFKDTLGKPLDVFQKTLEETGKKDAPTLFWVGNIWGSWIAGSEGAEAMADLPWVEALIERVLQLDPGYYYGGAHLFKAILLSARPEQFGGNRKKAEEHFKKARAYGEGNFLMTDVYYAQYYARQTLDRDLFVSTLKRVLETPADIEPDLTLANTLAQRKAKKLMSQVDELF
ncbi:MAG: TRAP transporter TatT component family protein [Deltaproteobacteria bacterium]|nr:TRAP transporter TatT component family protein [Deltaproteobacteria bacterium]